MFQRINDTAQSTSRGNVLFEIIVKKRQFIMSINQKKEENMKKEEKLENNGQSINVKEVENKKSKNPEAESKEMGGEEWTSSERIITSAEQINSSSEQINSSSVQINSSSEQNNSSSEQINTSSEQINSSSVQINSSSVQINSSSVQINSSSEQFNSSTKEINTTNKSAHLKIPEGQTKLLCEQHNVLNEPESREEFKECLSKFSDISEQIIKDRGKTTIRDSPLINKRKKRNNKKNRKVKVQGTDGEIDFEVNELVEKIVKTKKTVKAKKTTPQKEKKQKDMILKKPSPDSYSDTISDDEVSNDNHSDS